MLTKYLNLAVSAAKGTMMAQENAMAQLIVAAVKAYRINFAWLDDEEVDAMAEFIEDLHRRNPSLSTSQYSVIVSDMMERNFFTKSYFMGVSREKKLGNPAGYEMLFRRTLDRAIVTGC